MDEGVIMEIEQISDDEYVVVDEFSREQLSAIFSTQEEAEEWIENNEDKPENDWKNNL